MSYQPFKNLCEYYLDYIIEDGTDSLNVFASGFSLSYLELNNPELSLRENLELSNTELIKFNELYLRQTAGNIRKSWWYGYPNLVKFVTSKNGWRGGFIKPLFVLNIEIDNTIPILLPSTPRINNDAFKDLGLDLEQIRALADNLDLFSDKNYNFGLTELSSKLIELFPNIELCSLNNDLKFSALPYNDEIKIYNKGIILATESSKVTQGLEKELSVIKDSNELQIKNSSLVSFFPELKTKLFIGKEINISEAIELNEQQRETVQSVFKNRFTVVTGPPGTGKSQVVASIVINAAKNGERVLVASKNHKAVDVLEERLNQFAQRPFIIRLGRKGSDDRNIQQELLQYLNGLLGVAPDNNLNSELVKLQLELNELFAQKHSLINQIEDYRTYRNNINKYSALWEEISRRLDEKISAEIFKKCLSNKLSILEKIKVFLLKDWKNINNYSKLLKTEIKLNLEELTIKLTDIELAIRKKSKNEFIKWLNNFPSRLDGNKRSIIADFVSTLEQIIDSGNGISKKVWARLLSNRDRLMKELSGFLPAWCVTNLSARGQLPFIEGFFDILIIDEASQCDIASALPLLYRSKRAVIIGDPNQLTHISTLKTGRSVELMQNNKLTDVKYSIFEATKNSLYRLAASRAGDNKIIMLKEHFRSHKDIIAYSNKTWYGESLEIGTDYNLLKPIPNENTPAVEWIDVIGNIQQLVGSGAFIVNEVNAVVEKVFALTNTQNANYSIGIVTPFRFQANKIREALINSLTGNIWSKCDLLIDTAVKFQGDERDIMIFSPVITSNMPKGIRYYHESEYNLLNVAITRARSKLIIVGNLNASLNCGITYIQNFAQYVKNLYETEDEKAFGGEFESPFEKLLYEELLKNNIQTIPQYNYDQYRLDLAYIKNDVKIDIEVDGVSYHSDLTGERIKQDIIRNKRLQKKGWKVLRFWSYEIRDNLNSCIDKIIKLI
jgi:superfamily I DNA and/or RNA helicase/very-short-patch-repair endonuclease